MSLEKLDTEFNQIWLSTTDLPTSIETWQDKLAKYVDKNSDSIDREELSRLLTKWESTLKKNRNLISEQQDTLRDRLKEGEENSSKRSKANRFKGNL